VVRTHNSTRWEQRRCGGGSPRRVVDEGFIWRERRSMAAVAGVGRGGAG